MYASGSSAATAQDIVKVYVYNYASQIWAPLMVHGGDGNWYQASVETANQTNLYEQNQYWIFEIAGADRVAFVGDGTNDPTIFAACSTF